MNYTSFRPTVTKTIRPFSHIKASSEMTSGFRARTISPIHILLILFLLILIFRPLYALLLAFAVVFWNLLLFLMHVCYVWTIILTNCTIQYEDRTVNPALRYILLLVRSWIVVVFTLLLIGVSFEICGYLIGTVFVAVGLLLSGCYDLLIFAFSALWVEQTSLVSVSEILEWVDGEILQDIDCLDTETSIQGIVGSPRPYWSCHDCDYARLYLKSNPFAMSIVNHVIGNPCWLNQKPGRIRMRYDRCWMLDMGHASMICWRYPGLYLTGNNSNIFLLPWTVLWSQFDGYNSTKTGTPSKLSTIDGNAAWDIRTLLDTGMCICNMVEQTRNHQTGAE